MKALLLAKYQQLLTAQQTDNTGFTLIELIVVILILGILATIGMNTILNEIPKAKQAEAKTNIAHINSAQSTYWLTRGTFANNMSDLAIGLPTSTANYSYIISGNSTLARVNATSTDTMLKGYVGVVERYLDGNNEPLITSIICEAAQPGNLTSLPTNGRPGTNACGSNIELGQ